MTTDDTKQIKNEFIEHRNHERADRALAGVIAYNAVAGYPVEGHEHGVVTEITAAMVDPTERFEPKDLQTAVLDLVNDLMHLAARNGLNWPYIVERSAQSYQEEQTES